MLFIQSRSSIVVWPKESRMMDTCHTMDTCPPLKPQVRKSPLLPLKRSHRDALNWSDKSDENIYSNNFLCSFSHPSAPGASSPTYQPLVCVFLLSGFIILPVGFSFHPTSSPLVAFSFYLITAEGFSHTRTSGTLHIHSEPLIGFLTTLGERS